MHFTEQDSRAKPNLVALVEESDAAGAPALDEIEQVDDRIRKARELTERCNNFPMFEVAGFVQAYLHGELELGMRDTLGEAPNYGFVISAMHPTGDDGREGAVHFNPYDTQLRRKNIDGEKTLMLSHNVEQMEGIKKFVPSIVRFQRFDDRSFPCGERLYEFAPLVAAAGENVATFDYGKVGVINKVLAVAVSERRSEDIEAASDRIDVGAGFDLKRQRQRRFVNSNYSIVQGIRWQLFDDYLNVFIEPSVKARLEVWELGFGPIDRGFGM
jgi:hypothetical protein